LVTGEERKFADEKNEASKHVSCTVEMANVNTPCMLTMNSFSIIFLQKKKK